MKKVSVDAVKVMSCLEVLEVKQKLWQQRIIDYADEMKAVAAMERFLSKISKYRFVFIKTLTLIKVNSFV